MIIILLVAALLIVLFAVDYEPVKERPDPWPCNRCGRPNWSRLKMCVECRGVLGIPRDFHIEAPPIAIPMTPDLQLDDSGRLLEDIACRGCGYNLRGLTTQSACPECSVPVAFSIRADLLRYSNPQWLDRVTRGLGLMIIGLIVSSIFGFVSAVIGGGMFRSGAGSMVVMGLISFIGMGFSAVYALGVWQMTTRESDADQTGRMISARQVARWVALIELFSTPLNMATIAVMGNAAIVSGNPFGAPTPLMMMLQTAALMIGIIMVIGKIAGLMWLRQIVLRVPSRSIASQFTVVMWGYGIAAGITQPVAIGFQLLIPSTMTPGGPSPGATSLLLIFSGVSCVGGLAILTFSIWGLVLLMMSYANLKGSADMARQNWYHGV